MTVYQNSISNELSLLPNCALKYLEAVLSDIDISQIVHHAGRKRAFGARNDWRWRR